MTALETAIVAVCLLVIACVLIAFALLNVGPELETRLRLWRLQKCYDACAASHEIGTQEHRVCTDICLAKYHLDGEE